MLDALGEVHDLGAVFPFLRPDAAALAAFADRTADELGDEDDISPERVEEGLTLLDDSERRRLVEDYAQRHPDPWAEVCESIGDRALAERTLVASAVRAAIGDRRLPPRGVLEEVERNEDVIDSPAKVLAFLLQPSRVWSLFDLFAAAEAAGSLRTGSREWIAVVDDVAYARTARTTRGGADPRSGRPRGLEARDRRGALPRLVIFVDTNALTYASGSDHPLRGPARALFTATAEGRVSATTTTDVIQEFVHVYSRRRSRAEAAGQARRWLSLLSPLASTTQEDVPVALRLFERHEPLNSFDALLAAVALREHASALVSADRAFEAVPKLPFVELSSPELDYLLA